MTDDEAIYRGNNPLAPRMSDEGEKGNNPIAPPPIIPSEPTPGQGNNPLPPPQLPKVDKK